MIDLLEPYISQIIIGIGGIGAWFYERQKRRSELEASNIANVQSVVDLYQDAMADMKKTYDNNISELDAKYNQKFEELELKLKNLQDNVNLWKGKYRKLKEEFDAYKLKHEK